MQTQPQAQLITHSEDWKREVAEIFFARRRIIGTTMLLIFVCSVLIAFLWPPTYVATGSILIQNRKPPSSPTSLEVKDVRVFDLSQEDVSSELEILTSPDLIRQTLQRMRDGGDRPASEGPASSAADRIRGALSGPVDRAAEFMAGTPEESDESSMLVRKVRSRLKTEVIPSSKVIKIRLTDRNPRRAEQFLDRLMDEYIRFRSAVFNPASQEKFLKDRTDDYQKKLEQNEDSMSAAITESSVTMVQREMEKNVALRGDLQAKLFALRDQYVDSRYIDNPTLEARMKLFQMEIKNLEDRNVELHKLSTRYKRMDRQADLLDYSFRTFARRAEEARINQDVTASSISSEVSILSRAGMSAERAFPKKGLTLFLGLLVGFITGCSLGFMVEFFDHTFKRPEDVERYGALPVLCSITRF
jgi:uncharacterized protein involved in exopolysaccharide biosynthesis